MKWLLRFSNFIRSRFTFPNNSILRQHRYFKTYSSQCPHQKRCGRVSRRVSQKCYCASGRTKSVFAVCRHTLRNVSFYLNELCVYLIKFSQTLMSKNGPRKKDVIFNLMCKNLYLTNPLRSFKMTYNLESHEESGLSKIFVLRRSYLTIPRT